MPVDWLEHANFKERGQHLRPIGREPVHQRRQFVTCELRLRSTSKPGEVLAEPRKFGEVAVGRLQRQTCGYNAWEVVVFDGDRVYLIYWLGEPARMEEERSAFDRFISTFRFAPE